MGMTAKILLAIPSVKTERNDKGSKLYTSYQIVCENSNFPDYPAEAKVYRRYNDFLWLYGRLKDEFEMTKNRKDPIPPPTKPPAKQPFGRFKEKFVEKRRQDLEEWIVDLAQHPVWPTLKAF